jgi:hypothetical protein
MKPITQGFYDEEEAASFIAAQTKINLATVRQFLQARFRYQELNYIVDSDEDLTADRAEHEDLITNSQYGVRYEDLAMLLRYVQRVTRFDEEHIARMIAEESGYMAQIGIVEAGCYDEEREWAAAIRQTHAESLASDGGPM